MKLLRRPGLLESILGRAGTLERADLAIVVQRLAGERNILETVFNALREGVLIIDADGVVEYANAAGAVITGLRDADVGKITLWRLVPAFLTSFGTLLNRHGDAAGVLPAVTRELDVAYPEPRRIRLDLHELWGDAPEARRYVLILRDITAEEAAADRREEDARDNAISPFAAAVAHELGNPLNSINIHLQVILRRLSRMSGEDAAAVAESVRVCVSEVERLDALVRNFLEAARPSPPQWQRVKLLDLIGEVLALLKSQCEDLGLRVTMDCKTNIPDIEGDPNQLKQVFFNLLKNAMEAMDKRGEITLTADADDERVIIKVRDTGVGMEREAVSRIFAPFFTTKQGGHGLGMVVVMRILRAHGAEIGFESNVGCGTTVTVAFKRKDRIRVLPVMAENAAGDANAGASAG